MTDLPIASSESLRRVLGGHDGPLSAVRRHAFRALMEGRAPTATELAITASLPADQIERAIADLRDAGALEIDPGGRVVGAHGLTQRSTGHTIVTSKETWHTWCAIDAVGIPAALGIDADVHTRCPTCRANITVVVRRGSPTAGGDPMLWQPGGACAHLIDDFCAAANLFCSIEHLERWRALTGDPPGRPLTISEVAEQGRRVWSDVAP